MFVGIVDFVDKQLLVWNDSVSDDGSVFATTPVPDDGEHPLYDRVAQGRAGSVWYIYTCMFLYVCAVYPVYIHACLCFYVSVLMYVWCMYMSGLLMSSAYAHLCSCMSVYTLVVF